jgi:hypothetical protein
MSEPARHRAARPSWWIGLLFAVGATCFLVGPMPGFVQLVGSAVDGLVFFVGSLFFTAAAGLQWFQSTRDADAWAARRRPWGELRSSPDWWAGWWAGGIQFAGTLLFNRSTYDAMQAGFADVSYDRLVWAPDALGSICFLVAGLLAFRPVMGGRRDRDWWIAAVNLAGCVAFGFAAAASYVVPSSGTVIDLAASNALTALGALGFLIGAVLLLPEPEPVGSPPG